MIETRTIGKPFDGTLIIYNKCKYHGKDEEGTTLHRDGIKNWQIVTDEDAEALEARTDGSCIDDYHEYLILNYTDGTSETYRNSYVDLFAVKLPLGL